MLEALILPSGTFKPGSLSCSLNVQLLLVYLVTRDTCAHATKGTDDPSTMSRHQTKSRGRRLSSKGLTSLQFLRTSLPL